MSQTPRGPRELAGHPLHQRFMVGKYEVIAQPIPGSTHMLRYTVFLRGTRLGATVSVPTESDCVFLENPPEVPPLKPFRIHYRRGRPKKSAAPANAVREGEPGLHREDLPAGLSLPEPRRMEDA